LVQGFLYAPSAGGSVARPVISFLIFQGQRRLFLTGDQSQAVKIQVK